MGRVVMAVVTKKVNSLYCIHQFSIRGEFNDRVTDENRLNYALIAIVSSVL